MATKSFVTEFKFNTKSGQKLVNAIDNSRKTEHMVTQSVKNVTNQKDLNKIMNSFLGAE